MVDAVKVKFSGVAFAGGLIIALVVGGFATVFAAVAGWDSGFAVTGAILGALPGLGLALLSRAVSRDGFAQGLLVGACIIALLGGLCGAAPRLL